MRLWIKKNMPPIKEIKSLHSEKDLDCKWTITEWQTGQGCLKKIENQR